MSQFKVGDYFRQETGGLPFLVRQGEKGPTDLMLVVWANGMWRPVEMRAIGMVHAFFCKNEDRLYPGPGQLGGDYWRAFLKLCEIDWRAASKKLAYEKAWADRKRRGVA